MIATSRMFSLKTQSRVRFFLRYLLVLTGLNLVWEFAHMPLYTLAAEGTTAAIVYSAVHCTIGDMMIGGFALLAAVLLFCSDRWPTAGQTRVLAAALLFGVGYTIFSEWLNIEVRGAWAYTEAMPVIPLIRTGLSPLLQWLVVPVIAYFWAIRGEFDASSWLHSGANGTGNE